MKRKIDTPENFFEENEDIQKNFEKYMKEYEETNDKIMDSYYEENDVIKTLKSKKVIIGIIAVFFSLSCVAIISNYSNMGDNGMHKKDIEIAEQKKQQINADAAIQQQQIDEKKESDQQRQLEEKNKAESDKELNYIKNNFHPWENLPNDINDSTLNNSENISNNTMNSNNVPSAFNNNYSQNQVASSANSSASIPPVSTPDNNISDQTQYSNSNTNTNTDSEWMALKGIAKDKSGNIICYIKNGEITTSYYIGDYVGDYVITNITNSSVTVADSNGYKMNLNK